ncbi:MAG TPA: flagellar export protein FliJ [Candidatus Sumerlaeota bacterium]|nr:flagellar export protein FliJ [Candidatus Sumerlaeota bacterium]HPS01207.1 flagellar export protein FliJ [Candidatus Sumerlaeota bacterium]
MPFRFSLQEVLDYRHRIEEVRQAEMEQMRRQADEVRALIQQARQQRANYRAELNEQIQQGKGFAHQQIYLNYLKAMDLLIERSEEHLLQLQRELERRRLRLVQASRDRQVMDELKKDERKQYLIEERRLQTKDFDEIAVRNYLLSQREKNARSEEGNPS